MNKHAFGRRGTANIFPFILVGVIGVSGAAPTDWKSMITIAERKRDEQGNLLPLQSYDETIRRGMAFLMQDHLKWFKGPASTLLDEKGRTQMPWVYYSNLQHNGAPFSNSIDRFVSYPAFHHSLLIRTFIKFSKYSGDARALKEAVKLADWNIAHSTPGEWAYGNLPYSTFQEKKPGGFRDKTGLMPDKAAIMALTYIQLYKASRQARFLRAAEAIGHTLSQRQRPNGTWPFRVDPRTDKVIEEYTSSVIYVVMLFEKLDELNGNDRYRTYRDRTWNWLLNGPIKTKDFRGFYEDIPDRKSNRTNYDCLDTIRYLLANRTDTNGYLETARELNAWIEKIFLDKIKGFEPAEGIREQLQCNVVMGVHSLNWASMLRELAEASGDEKMRQRAIQTANYITYYLQPDNRILVGFTYKQWWYSCHTGVILYLLDFVENWRSCLSIDQTKGFARFTREQHESINLYSPGSRQRILPLESCRVSQDSCPASGSSGEEIAKYTAMTFMTFLANWNEKLNFYGGSWNGKQITLLFERTKNTRVWVDQTFCGWDDTLSAPQFFDATKAMTPGKHTITVVIDNAKLPPVGPAHAGADLGDSIIFKSRHLGNNGLGKEDNGNRYSKNKRNFIPFATIHNMLLLEYVECLNITIYETI